MTRLSSVHELKEFNGISGRFGGLSVSSFCSAATISLFVVANTRSSNKANPTSSCDRYQSTRDAMKVSCLWPLRWLRESLNTAAVDSSVADH